MDLQQQNKQREVRRRNNLDLQNMVYGKIPPQAKDIEEAILGAILVEAGAFDRMADLIKPEAFYVEAHQRIFEAMRRLSAKSQPIDILTVAEELRITGELDMVGGAYYVTKLTNSVVSAAHMESHCKIILQKQVQREMIRIAGEIMASAYEDVADAFELLDEAEELITNVSHILSLGDLVKIDSVLVQAVKKIEEWREMKSPITGVKSGFEGLDKATRGWQNTDLIIVAARPSVGKTALALNLVKNAAADFYQQFLNGQPHKSVAVWSLEMKSLMLILRMLSSESEEILYKIQTGRMEEPNMRNLYAKGIQKLAQLNIWFDDNPGVTIQKVRSKARKLKRQNNLGLIVIDYLQLMNSDERNGTREQEVSRISRGLKMLAMELDVPIIALSQMSREFDKRTGTQREPMLSDLRESGSIEQDADVVAFLWAPTDAEINENASLINRRHFKIAKQRNGMLIKLDLDFKDEIQRFNEASKFSDGLPSSFRPINIPKNTVDYTEPNSKTKDAEEDLPF